MAGTADIELEVCRWWWPTYFGGENGDAVVRARDSRLEEVGGVLDWFTRGGPEGGADFVRDVSLKYLHLNRSRG